jgi:hypothetical protein
MKKICWRNDSKYFQSSFKKDNFATPNVGLDGII